MLDYQKTGENYDDPNYTKAIKAGRRTYFFDVKATRGNDYFITITESRKRLNDDGSANFTRHQMHLYKEDFAKFMDGLEDIVNYVKEHKPDYFAENE